MILSNDDVAEISKVLSNIKIEKDDKHGIIANHVCGNLGNHFKQYLLSRCSSEEETDEFVIKYFTKTIAKKYLKFIPDYIKNKIIASSL
jgi:hypothetical protein